MSKIYYVTPGHKTSHKGPFLFFLIEIHISESWINKLSIDVLGDACYDRTIFGRDTTIWQSGIRGCKKINILRKSPLKVVQMKSLAMHITNQKYNFQIFTVDCNQSAHYIEAKSSTKLFQTRKAKLAHSSKSRRYCMILWWRAFRLETSPLVRT